ncbi:MAG: 2-C-methyl-D-erythritol 4-phosphate cytidylyltransferase [Candidatus Brocadiia bacterium]
MKVAAIIVAAGSSTRLKGKVHKPYLLLGRKPILLHSLQAFLKIPQISQIIIAAHPRDMERANRLVKPLISKYNAQIEIVIGGATRSHSVHNAFKNINKDINIVLIHDVARPFIAKEDIVKVINKTRDKGAAILARPVTDTIKSVAKGLRIQKTIPRNILWAAQTPQGFRKDIILKAYSLRKSNLADYTDDAGIVESIGAMVYIIEGSANNIKITTSADLWTKQKIK